jgi:hypothetical protein
MESIMNNIIEFPAIQTQEHLKIVVSTETANITVVNQRVNQQPKKK